MTTCNNLNFVFVANRDEEMRFQLGSGEGEDFVAEDITGATANIELRSQLLDASPALTLAGAIPDPPDGTIIYTFAAATTAALLPAGEETIEYFYAAKITRVSGKTEDFISGSLTVNLSANQS